MLLAVAAARWRWVHATYLALAVPLCAVGVVAFTQGQWVGWGVPGEGYVNGTDLSGILLT